MIVSFERSFTGLASVGVPRMHQCAASIFAWMLDPQ